MKVNTLLPASLCHRTTLLMFMTAIFICDTTTNYEIAVSTCYIVVIIIAAYSMKLRGLMSVTGVCICFILLSFYFTQKGYYLAGLTNLTIILVSIIIIYYLLQKIKTARAIAQQTQIHLLRIARVNSMKNLTISIVHEINQPLAAIITSSSACKRWLSKEPTNLDKALQALDRIQADAYRASKIIERLRNFIKGKPPQKTVFLLNEATQEILTLLQFEMERHGIILKVILMPEDSSVLADRIQIQQVIGNLISNAIDATLLMPAGKREIRITSERQKDRILFCIFDTGIGLSAETQAHLFEPFWTTKEEGIGVGLSISRTIIEANGGHIWAQSNQNAGTVFRFSIPTIKK